MDFTLRTKIYFLLSSIEGHWTCRSVFFVPLVLLYHKSVACWVEEVSYLAGSPACRHSVAGSITRRYLKSCVPQWPPRNGYNGKWMSDVMTDSLLSADPLPAWNLSFGLLQPAPSTGSCTPCPGRRTRPRRAGKGRTGQRQMRGWSCDQSGHLLHRGCVCDMEGTESCAGCERSMCLVSMCVHVIPTASFHCSLRRETMSPEHCPTYCKVTQV